ncbi:hypothetical protein P7D85_04680 [Enterococcus hulanensis]|uniref:Uncharacterized protein n=1 Tax=Enterococcus hulanensis TaxID=2559929 RepID=A0ABU3EXL5_9ENTE|nr:hypothetical protein [Enterococcus hulanensis]MDT2599058.1 hypothetical protein [Enterococcus hulanensis]MDT2610709.1 hypothetical protein [Enterococcus hulanensis]MDT2614733.1 hypothetical protein [Enterococcus hulanensis]MDT2627297.1 hypothetical protein [Enterococcus hulanensis]MDT2653803.1 hypothetical protein [Enterococcus hulanensis]
MKKSLKQLIQALLICLIVPSTLLLQKSNPYIDYDITYRSVFRLLLLISLSVLAVWSLKELWQVLRNKRR